MAVIASLFGAGQPDLFAQRIDECRSWVEIKGVIGAVDTQRNWDDSGAGVVPGSAAVEV
ncbi:hypothetical protein [Mycolicibacterium iranicum]|uniref:hypothetical protein n=1 Tax=Mycolicibacterium iranicum TaxID=912594 RepID=UPI002E13307F